MKMGWQRKTREVQLDGIPSLEMDNHITYLCGRKKERSTGECSDQYGHSKKSKEVLISERSITQDLQHHQQQ